MEGEGVGCVGKRRQKEQDHISEPGMAQQRDTQAHEGLY